MGKLKRIKSIAWFKWQHVANTLRLWITRPLLVILYLVWKNFNIGFGQQKKSNISTLIRIIRQEFAYERYWKQNKRFRNSSYTTQPINEVKPIWWREFIAEKERLQDIHENVDHEDHDEDDGPIDTQAMDHAVAFAATLHAYTCPVMWIYHAGQPRLVWYNRKPGSKNGFDEQVAILFRSNGRVTFVIFRDEADGEDTTFTGYTHIDQILDLVKAMGVEHVMKGTVGPHDKKV